MNLLFQAVEVEQKVVVHSFRLVQVVDRCLEFVADCSTLVDESMVVALPIKYELRI